MLLQLSNFGATASPHTVNVQQIRVYKKPASFVEPLFKHCRDFVGEGSVAKTENSIYEAGSTVGGWSGRTGGGSDAIDANCVSRAFRSGKGLEASMGLNIL